MNRFDFCVRVCVSDVVFTAITGSRVFNHFSILNCNVIKMITSELFNPFGDALYSVL